VDFDIERGGRWALLRRAPRSGGMDEQEKAAATEQVARTLLQRYGVIFWRLLARELAGCRHGAICSAFTAVLRHAVKSGAGIS
jgi:hypothetical protein